MKGLRLGLSLVGKRAFSASSLFAGGEAGGWYDPSDLTTLFQDTAGTTPVTADGDPVGRMNDKSGNGNHFIQGTAAARPLYKTSGGLHWLLFQGIDDHMTCTPGAAFSGADATGAIAFQFAAGTSTSGRLLSLHNNATADWNNTSSISFCNRDGAADAFTTAFNSVGPAAIALAADTDAVFLTDVQANSFRQRKDKGAFSTTAAARTPAFNADRFKMGCDNVPAAFFVGRIYGALFVDRLLTSTEQDGLTSYLAAKQGRAI